MTINLALECASKKIQEDFGLHVFPHILPCAVDCKLLGQNLCASKKIQEDFGLHVFPHILPCAVDCKLLGQNLNTKHVSHAKAIMETDYGAKVDNGLKDRRLKLTTFGTGIWHLNFSTSCM
jgi:hypothetical protein